MSSQPILERRSTVIWLVLAILAFEVLSAVGIVAILPGWPEREAFGGMFGATASLFSGLALAGVVYAILLQRQELALQRQELELTRTELERSANAQEESARLLQRQLDFSKDAAQAESRRRRAEVEPDFGSAGGRYSATTFELSVTNHGATIRDVEVVDPEGAASVNIFRGGVVQNGGKIEFKITYEREIPSLIKFGH